MQPTAFRVVLDANVLFPFTVRDTLLRAAAMGWFQVRWSEEILAEATRNLIKTGRMTQVQSNRLMAAMHSAFPDALVEGYEGLVDSMPNQEKDRHVAAAAVKSSAQLIVTNNLKDFRKLPTGLEAQSPDIFLQSLLNLDTNGMGRLLRNQASALKRPPISLTDLLVGLGKTVPRFAAQCRALFLDDVTP